MTTAAAGGGFPLTMWNAAWRFTGENAPSVRDEATDTASVAVCASAVNGFITVDSEPGKGTQFRIYLPISDGSLPQVAAVAMDPGNFRGTETLLVVEDDPSVRSLSRTVLETYGYRVIEAVDGMEAVKKFREHGDEIRLVIMDVVMPKMNGNQAFAEIQKIRPDAEVLFISGHTQDIIHDKGVVDGGYRFMKKPFKPLELVKKVRALLDLEEKKAT